MPVVTLAREQTAAGLPQKTGFKRHVKSYGKARHYSGLAKNQPFKDFQCLSSGA